MNWDLDFVYITVVQGLVAVKGMSPREMHVNYLFGDPSNSSCCTSHNLI